MRAVITTPRANPLPPLVIRVAQRLHVAVLALVVLMSVMTMLSGVITGSQAAASPPSRPGLLILCNAYCQHFDLYAQPPTDVREREWFDIGRRMAAVVTAGGGSVYYLGNLDDMSNDATSAALIAATLRNHAIGTVVCFSDLAILPLLPQVLFNVLYAPSIPSGSILSANNASAVAALWELQQSEVSATTSAAETPSPSASPFTYTPVAASQKYALVILDDLLSGDGTHDAFTHIDIVGNTTSTAATTSATTNINSQSSPLSREGHFGRRFVAMLWPFQDAVFTVAVAGANNFIGYAAGAAAAAACGTIPSSFDGTCHVGILLRSGSQVLRELRAGIQMGLLRGASGRRIIVSGAYVSPDDEDVNRRCFGRNRTLCTQAVVQRSLSAFSTSSNGSNASSSADAYSAWDSTARLMGFMQRWKGGSPVSVVITDSIDDAMKTAISAYKNVSRSAVGSAALHDTKLYFSDEDNVTQSIVADVSVPLVAITVLGNSTTVANLRTMSASTSATGWMNVGANVSTVAVTVLSWLSATVSSANADSSGSVLEGYLEGAGRCFLPSIRDASECAGWMVRPMSSSDYGMSSIATPLLTVTEVLPAGAENAPLTDTGAASMLTAYLQPLYLNGSLETWYDYRRGAVLLKAEQQSGVSTVNSWSTSRFPPSLNTMLKQQVATVVDAWPVGASESLYLLNPQVFVSVAEPDAAVLLFAPDPTLCESNRSFSGSCVSVSELLGLRYEVASNSLDRVLVGSQGGADPVLWAPYQLMGLSTATASVITFGGRLANGSYAQVMRAIDISKPGSRWSVVDIAAGSSSSSSRPIGRGDASWTECAGGAMVLYGGRAVGERVLDDIWSFDPVSKNWTEILPASTANKPLVGRYLHTAAYVREALSYGNVTDSDWLVIAGGRNTVQQGDVRTFGLNSRTWLPAGTPPNQPEDVETSIPCLMFLQGRLVVAFYASSSAVLQVLFIGDTTWTTITVANWTSNGGQCTTMPSVTASSLGAPHIAYSELQTAVIAVGGQQSFSSSSPSPLSTIARLVYGIVDCSAMLPKNVHTSSAGLECEPCADRTYASSSDTTTCTACPVTSAELESLASAWQVGVCYVSDTTRGTTAFALIVFLQVVAVPMLMVCSNAIMRSRAWVEDEFAVTELSEAVVDMLLERVAFLDHMENPSAMQKALAMCVTNIKIYRRLIPLSVLNLLDWLSWRMRRRMSLIAEAAAAAQAAARQDSDVTGAAIGTPHEIALGYHVRETAPLEGRWETWSDGSQGAHVGAPVTRLHGGGGGESEVELSSQSGDDDDDETSSSTFSDDGDASRPFHSSQSSGSSSYTSTDSSSQTSTEPTSANAAGTQRTHRRRHRHRRSGAPSAASSPDSWGQGHGNQFHEQAHHSRNPSVSALAYATDRRMTRRFSSRPPTEAGAGTELVSQTADYMASRHRAQRTTPGSSEAARSGLSDPVGAGHDASSHGAGPSPSTDPHRHHNHHHHSHNHGRSQPHAARLWNVTSAILRSLVPHLHKRRVTVMYVQFGGLSRWRAPSQQPHAAPVPYSPHQQQQVDDGNRNNFSGPFGTNMTTTTSSSGVLRESSVMWAEEQPSSPVAGIDSPSHPHPRSLSVNQQQQQHQQLQLQLHKKQNAAFFRQYSVVADTVTQIVQEHDGVPDMFFGDAMLASWNAMTPCDSPEHAALLAAHHLGSSSVVRAAKLRVASAVATGQAMVGVVGGDGCRRLTLLSPIISDCKGLALECRNAFDVSCAVELTHHVQQTLTDAFVFRILGAVHFVRRSEKRGQLQAAVAAATAGGPTGSGASLLSAGLLSPTSANVSQAVGPAVSPALGPNGSPPNGSAPGTDRSRRLVAELLGPSSLSQWQYELKGRREHIDCYNTVIRTIFEGRLEDARRIPLPRTMPKWHQEELAQMQETGVIQTVTVPNR